MISLLNKKMISGKVLVLLIMLLALTSSAQSVTISDASSSVGLLWWLIYGVMAILLFAILILSNVLLNLARLTVEKSKVSKKSISVILLLMISSIAFAQETTKVGTAGSAFSPVSWNFTMAAIVLLAEVAVLAILLFRIQSMLNELSDKKQVRKPYALHLPRLFDNLNASVAVEKEMDILLDHNYDGIRELDNALPPWWKYGFYVTIVYAIMYMGYYTFGGGLSSIEEYQLSVEQGKMEVEAYMKANALNVDENTVTMGDGGMIAEGKKLFTDNCAACHGVLGEGNAVGPNLADTYWIHGGSLSDIFKSIKYGWPAKGMRAWQDAFAPVQIQQLTTYIKSIEGSNPPNAKEPQGELYREVAAAGLSVDSTTVTYK